MGHVWKLQQAPKYRTALTRRFRCHSKVCTHLFYHLYTLLFGEDSVLRTLIATGVYTLIFMRIENTRAELSGTAVEIVLLCQYSNTRKYILGWCREFPEFMDNTDVSTENQLPVEVAGMVEIRWTEIILIKSVRLFSIRSCSLRKYTYRLILIVFF